MKRFAPRRTIHVPRRFFVSLLFLLSALFLAVPALAAFLGPDRTSSQFITVRDPDNDVWTLTHVDPLDAYADVCLIVHTCDEHPSVDRQTALCGWVADNSGCSEAHKTEEVIITLAEATIADDLQGCNLNNGWCTTSPTLQLTANEPLPGESITLIEGTRNGEAFACTSDTCNVPLLEGGNTFSFWALSSYGDGSRMGNLSAQVDTVPPSSAVGSPPEGSSVSVSGVLDMSGPSSDASSGVSSAEISLDGGGSWQGLSLAGGSWGYTWDTSGVPDGSYPVWVRARDVAGHLESTARITVYVDRTPPSANLPDEWKIWEPISFGAEDSGVGVKTVELTIHGGSYGVRKYLWPAGSVPVSFLWDRFFGSIVAPIGEYKVTLKVSDTLGNSSSASGTIVIPAPPTAEPAASSVPPTALPPTAAPLPTATSGSAGSVIISTATPQALAAGPGSGLAAAPLDDSAAPVNPGVTEVLPPPGGINPILWGGAALAAAAAATAYALSRRRAREATIERMRQQMTEESSASALSRRLRALRARAEARIAPLRNVLLATVAVAKAAQEVQRRQKVQYKLARYVERLDRIGAPSTPIQQMAVPQLPDRDLAVTYQLGQLHGEQQSSPLVLLTGVGVGGPSPTPTPTAPYPTPTTTPAPSSTPTPTPDPTASATLPPTETPTPTPLPTYFPILPTNTPGITVFNSKEFQEQLADSVEAFRDSFSLVREPSPAYPDDFLTPFEFDPRTAPIARVARVILTAYATIRDLLSPFAGLDPTYPASEPIPGGPSGREVGGDDVS